MSPGAKSAQSTRLPPRFVAMGASDFTVACASGVLDGGAELVGVIGIPETSRPENSMDLATFAREHHLEYREFDDLNSAPALAALRSYDADYLMSSWPFILSAAVLSIPRRFVIGSHPTALPFNRGRHPAHWTIILGLRTSALTFFRMDEGVDTGNVLQQTPFIVPDEITVGELNLLIAELARPASEELCRRLADDPEFEGIPQDASLANYWRKRTPHDVTIDFRMSGDLIVRTVRSFAPPYPGAILMIDAHVIRVSHGRVIQTELAPERFAHLEPGRVIEVASRHLIVKAADAVVELGLVTELPNDVSGIRYIHPPSRYVHEYGDLTSRVDRG